MSEQIKASVELGVTVEIDTQKPETGGDATQKTETASETVTAGDAPQKTGDDTPQNEPAQQTTDKESAPPQPVSNVSFFANEKQVAMLWLTYITIYWSVVMWVPSLLEMNFATPGFGIYCIGLIAIFAEGAAIYGDFYPSGATKDNPNGFSGGGRYSAIFLVVCIIADLYGLAYVVLNRDTQLAEYFRASCHFFALVWCSLFYFNRLVRENAEMAWGVFWEEWIDIVLTIIIVLLLHSAYQKKHPTANDTCFETGLCSTYWCVFVVQLSGWMIPMMTIEGWGAERHATKVALHLFLLDLFTNVPILVAVVATSGYEVSPAIFFDVLWKAGGFILSTAYFMVYYLWLQRGKKSTTSKDTNSDTIKPNF